MKYQLEDCASAPIMSSVASKKQKKGASTPKRTTWTVEPSDDLKSQMETALEVTGVDRTEILLRCIKKELPDVVREILKEREAEKQAAEAFRNEFLPRSGEHNK